jgi:Icc-related predicted phosphoesterase
VIRIGAVGDLHLGADSVGRAGTELAEAADDVDVLLLAGDLTRCGTVDEARIVAKELSAVRAPTFAVLGNHDHHADQTVELCHILADSGIGVLEGTSTVIAVRDTTLAIVGAKGFGGGFAGACGSDFGEPEMKAFIRHTKDTAARLEHALAVTTADRRVVLLHYSPIEATLRGERPEIFPFLGSYLLAAAIDAHGADLVVHGHAHAGVERGMTPGGIPVRNVAQPVLRAPLAVYQLGATDAAHGEPARAASAQG